MTTQTEKRTIGLAAKRHIRFKSKADMRKSVTLPDRIPAAEAAKRTAMKVFSATSAPLREHLLGCAPGATLGLVVAIRPGTVFPCVTGHD